MVVKGGVPLYGDVTVSGSKNAAVAILPAALLANGPCVIENVPRILDVKIIMDILNKLGATTEWIGENTVRIDSHKINTHIASYETISRLRASYYFIGALLGKIGKAEVSQSGGCNLGSRPIDQHLKGFAALGVIIKEEHGLVKANGTNMVGANIYFDVVSVGATINLIIAAVKAKGTTVLENCAREPHVVDLANFLNSMGANIKGAGTNVIRIKGVSELNQGITYTVIPDQIEAGTFIIAAIATSGDVKIKNIIPRHQEALLAKLTEMGVGLEEGEDWVRVFYKGPIVRAKVKTLPYPGFPTDLQPQISVLLSMAEGTSTVSESIWDSRFQYVDELKRMGAEINVEGKTLIIEGKKKLFGAPVRCPDLRAGAALVIAALAAEGTTEIYDIKYIDRGYEDFENKLRQLGASIIREEYTE